MLIWIRNTAFFLANMRICDLQTGTSKKFADLRLRNEPKNLRICDLRFAHLCYIVTLTSTSGLRIGTCSANV
jgi:hypothetical protein